MSICKASTPSCIRFSMALAGMTGAVVRRNTLSLWESLAAGCRPYGVIRGVQRCHLCGTHPFDKLDLSNCQVF